MRVAHQVLDVSLAARKEVVEANDLVAGRYKALTKVRTQETSTSSDKSRFSLDPHSSLYVSDPSGYEVTADCVGTKIPPATIPANHPLEKTAGSF
jgi:hypothetical protein